jgi:uncharacterized protein involved in type VI secretion and phage assembly
MFSFHYFAKVTDNKDPDGLNRVRVARTGDGDSVTDWIPVITPWAGSGAGLSALPEPGSQVLVVSLDSREIKKAVLGGLWSAAAPPPETRENPEADLNQDGKNSLRFIKSRAGSMIIFDDTEGAEKIQIISAGGKSRLEFLTAGEILSLETDTDITIGAKGSLAIQAEEIEISGAKAVSLRAEEIMIAAKKNLEAAADRDMTLKGSSISLN